MHSLTLNVTEAKDDEPLARLGKVCKSKNQHAGTAVACMATGAQNFVHRDVACPPSGGVRKFLGQSKN